MDRGRHALFLHLDMVLVLNQVGPMATVWDGEVVGFERGLRAAGDREPVLLLTDSKAVIQSIRKSCLTGRARRGHWSVY